MIPFNPYNRLKQPLPAQPEQFNPAAGAPQTQWAPNVGEQQGGDLQAAGRAIGRALDTEGDAPGMLAQYLKKRRAQTSPALSDTDLNSTLAGGL